MMREQEQLDPEVEAEFDQAFERMMAESLDSRKFERKAQFDVPLPIRKVQRMPVDLADDEAGSGVESPANTMAFSLMTKKGNRQQVSRTVCGHRDTKRPRIGGNTADSRQDENDRTSLRFQLRAFDEVSAGCRA